MVNSPPVVWVGFSVPQAPTLPQVTVQSTPALVESFSTTAVAVVLWFTANDLGGATAKKTEIAVAVEVMVNVEVAVAEELAVAVAVTVTVFPVGTEAGAV